MRVIADVHSGRSCLARVYFTKGGLSGGGILGRPILRGEAREIRGSVRVLDLLYFLGRNPNCFKWERCDAEDRVLGIFMVLYFNCCLSSSVVVLRFVVCVFWMFVLCFVCYGRF